MSEFRCPICKKPSRPSDPHFPFCSKRCKLIDLGSWLDGRYRISRPLCGPPQAPPRGLGPGERPAREGDPGGEHPVGETEEGGLDEEAEPPPVFPTIGTAGERASGGAMRP